MTNEISQRQEGKRIGPMCAADGGRISDGTELENQDDPINCRENDPRNDHRKNEFCFQIIPPVEINDVSVLQRTTNLYHSKFKRQHFDACATNSISRFKECG